jgi:putative ABC transport system permease protein
MIFNYLKIAFRNIKKHKSFTTINVAGLAIGLACCILLSIFIHSELSFDDFHIKKDRIFRVGEDMTFNNFSGKQSGTNGVIAEALKKYPEVEETVRFRYLRTSVKFQDKQFVDRFYYTDKTIFNVFTWPFIDGNPQTALESPFSIVLTKETANKYFGSENPIGKVLILNEDESYKVTGVIEDVPQNSTRGFRGLCSISTLYAKHGKDDHILTAWTSHNFNTYVLLKAEVNGEEFEEKIKNIYYDYAAEDLKANGSSYSVFLQPLKDIYLRPLNRDFGPIMYVYIFSAIAAFILLIACVNFMNLSTARSMSRADEVGLRKVFGAGRGRLIGQFLTEAILLSCLSIIVALGIVFILLPVISDFADRDLSQGLLNMAWLIPGITGITLLVGLLAGSYPAFYLSRFEPVRIIKNKLAGPKANANLRRSLVILQFTISITLIIGTGLIVQQLDYLKSKDVGFDKENVVCLSVRDQLFRQKLPILRDKFGQLPGVINTGASSRLPGWGGPMNSKIPEGYPKENTQLMREINIDENYLSTVGIEIVKGRNFSKEYSTDPRGSIIINETAAQKFGWENPIGKTIQTINTDIPGAKVYESRKVIGVVKDYHLNSVTRTIEPEFIANVVDYPFNYGKIQALAIRIKPENIQTTLSELEAIWLEVFSDKPFNYYFLDEDFDEQFIGIERTKDILSYFTFLAIFIACLGLFGMVSFSAEKRTKEIGIRKTLGSSVSQIVSLLSKELLLLVLAANIVAYPIAYFVIAQWLKDFPYKMEIDIYTFVISTIFALLISLATVAYQSIKAALANPVDSLRYE